MSDMRSDYPLIVGVGGLKESGKDTLSLLYQQAHPDKKVTILNMSDPLRIALEILDPIFYVRPSEIRPLGLYKDDIPYYNYREIKETAEEMGKDPYTQAKLIKSVREFLQKLGTEFGRDVIDPNIWINHARKSIQNAVLRGADAVFLTGIRFKNELDLVGDFNNHRTVWVERSSVTKNHTDRHASEVSLSFASFGTIIVNDGTLEEFQEEVVRRLG